MDSTTSSSHPCASTPEKFVVPAPLGALLAHLPAYPGSLLLVTALNMALRRHLPADVAHLLTGKKMRIQVRDARLTFDFTWMGHRFVPRSPLEDASGADLTLSASAHDFLLLAQRQQDPDTLFFHRRLSMEGDTELGLVVKNALDAMELPVLDPRQWTPRHVMERLRGRRVKPRS
ncbi:ubiquinone anaerobic biosynthesis accessory factor UbiT [Ottowia thiooxydans]|uniref:ubiquinone anaerobic biosynthesis accessory factor UbiT n=1 Tax=Ottowia thiooxydans TaxID=219182 RepID=UPI0004176E5A|nr:SCP2 sterol-binding domain-containing protein [Ottowia thiooxydans]